MYGKEKRYFLPVSEMVRNSHSEHRTATTVEGILPILPKKEKENEMSSDLKNCGCSLPSHSFVHQKPHPTIIRVSYHLYSFCGEYELKI